MYNFQDYYGDYYGEEAPCDPYYEDCAAPEEETMEDDMMMEEGESASVSPLVTLWGLVPALDIVVGFMTLDDFPQDDEQDGVDDFAGTCMMCDMQNQGYLQISLGTISLLGWGAAQFMEMSGPFLILSKVHILSEALMFFNEYRAWNVVVDNYVAEPVFELTADDMNADPPESKAVAYGVHGFGLVYAAASMMAVADAYAVPEEEMDMEYYGEEYYGEEADDAADDYYGGDYYYGGYY